MTAYLFPMDGAWMLKIDTLGIYVDSKEEGIEMCQMIAKEKDIDTLTIAETNNGFRTNIDE